MTSTKSVAIVGAGPGGLVCASKLLKLTHFSVTIFEKVSDVGGLWEPSFSDLAWESVDLGRPAPVYPKAWMVEKYLQTYAKKYVLDGCFEFDTCVTSAEREGAKWKLVTMKNGEAKTSHFDYLVVAAGYLSTPKALDCEIDEALNASPVVPILHSIQYRKLDQIFPFLPMAKQRERPRVLVIGGSHSGSDISALLALQASNARWAPGGNSSKQEIEIIHVMHNRMYTSPGLTRDCTSESVSFHPLEFTLCERATRGPEPISFSFALASRQQNDMLKNFYKEVIEGASGEESEDDDDGENELPPFAVMSDAYTQYVEAGVIKPQIGVVKRLEKDKCAETITAIVRSRDDKERIFDGITAVINATGFNSGGSLSFLSEEVKKQLEFDVTNTRLPFVLDSSYMAQHSSVPDIVLLGFTPVNWGVMEMQSRAVASKWAYEEVFDDPEQSEALGNYIRDLRDAMKNEERSADVPQYLFSDFLGLMEQAGRELGTKRINGTYSEFEGFICAARYMGQGEDITEAVKTMDSVQHLQQQIWDKDFLVARVAFLGLLGRWESQSQKNDSNSMSHVLDAHTRYPTSPDYDLEYVFVHTMSQAGLEEKDFFIARYSEATDEITVWSMEEDNELKPGKLACTLSLYKNDCGEIEATADLPWGGISFRYELKFKGSKLKSFSVTRQAKNTTDYTTLFERPKLQTDGQNAQIEPVKKLESASRL